MSQVLPKVLLDSTVFVYAIGAAHQFKAPCVDLLDRVAAGKVPAVIDSELFQEILYLYWHRNEWQNMEDCFNLARLSVQEILPVEARDTDRALDLFFAHRDIQPRDAIHAAIALRYSLPVCSHDKHFDKLASIGVVRMTPEDVLSLLRGR